jgi:hypothetical protein
MCFKGHWILTAPGVPSSVLLAPFLDTLIVKLKNKESTALSLSLSLQT